MPYSIIKNFNNYSIVDSSTGHLYSKHITFNRAKKEMDIFSLYKLNVLDPTLYQSTSKRIRCDN